MERNASGGSKRHALTTIRGARESVKRGGRESSRRHRTANRAEGGAGGENRDGLAAEVGEKPEEEREDEAEDEAGDDGKVKRSMLAAMDDVSGKFAEAKRQFGVEIEDGTDDEQKAPEEEESTAKFAERIHTRRAL